jgi:hypothetical protein
MPLVSAAALWANTLEQIFWQQVVFIFTFLKEFVPEVTVYQK